MNSLEVLDREIEDLEAELRPHKEAVERIEAKIKNRKAARVPLLKDASAVGDTDPSAKPSANMDVEVMALEIFAKRSGRHISKADLRNKLVADGAKAETGNPSKSVNQSLRTLTNTGKLTRSGKGKHFPDEEMIGPPKK